MLKNKDCEGPSFARVKKHLGQHFLTSRGALEKIVRALAIAPGDTVLEIGPGRGILTEALLAAGARVIAVEKDPELVAMLTEVHADAIKQKTLAVIAGDILDPAVQDTLPSHYKIAGNIPYYITGSIIRTIFSYDPKPSRVVLLVQKEVAERIVEKDGKGSVLSQSVRVYGTPHMEGVVRAGSFNPPPKVDSAILSVSDIHTPFSDQNTEKHFFDTLKRGFSHKRKLLRGNLGASEEVLTTCGIHPAARAEDLTTKHWLCLSRTL